MTTVLQSLFGVGQIPSYKDKGFLWRLEAVLEKFRIVYNILVNIMNPPSKRDPIQG